LLDKFSLLSFLLWKRETLIKWLNLKDSTVWYSKQSFQSSNFQRERERKREKKRKEREEKRKKERDRQRKKALL
jgi:hypothetical protein